MKGIWSQWQFYFTLWIKRSSIWFLVIRLEDCHYVHIPFNLKENGNIFFWMYTESRISLCNLPEGCRVPKRGTLIPREVDSPTGCITNHWLAMWLTYFWVFVILLCIYYHFDLIYFTYLQPIIYIQTIYVERGPHRTTVCVETQRFYAPIPTVEFVEKKM